ncbi:outer membrane protein assembly factor [Aliifodinibius salicampi]|uniref:Outer membrane protein assembly factor n=1 Tax=Fodinibius salicampi TaxID=1920655 RepID=A0ABT3PZ67_9BACT|nr:BamA/TamA family outer membrane protein [Fodinibius salicampi]MCW9713167.1 outer membrane protein assembly factor [Fodinibius salicampi]
MVVRFFVIVSLFVLMGIHLAQGQQADSLEGSDAIVSALVPAVGYTSSAGLIGGLAYNRYNYLGDIKPFKSYLKSSALVSVKGLVEINGSYDRTRNFGKPIRSVTSIYFRRFPKDNFFEKGNESSFNSERWEEGYYHFESISFGLDIDLRRPIFNEGEKKKRLDLMGGIETSYYIPYINKEPSSFSEADPLGRQGGWLNFVKAGLDWENRDREFDPRRGNKAIFELRYAPELISKYGMGSIYLDMRQYFQLFNQVKIANRLEARHAFGDVPYWELSTMADDASNVLRGYAMNRFRGNSSVAYTLELRSWVVRFPDFYKMKLGLQLFTDTGRVFTEENDLNDLLKGYKKTVGFGGALSVLSPDFVLRGDIGFSEEGSRIYVGVGYLF